MDLHSCVATRNPSAGEMAEGDVHSLSLSFEGRPVAVTPEGWQLGSTLVIGSEMLGAE